MIPAVHDDLERRGLAGELADAATAGPWNAEAIAERGAACLNRWPSWMALLALRIVAVHHNPPVGRRGELVDLIDAFLAEHPWTTRQSEPALGASEPALGAPGTPARFPIGRVPVERRWPVAELDSLVTLAARLELDDGQLAWLADVRGLERTVPDTKLRNYRYRTAPRRSGLPRVIEAPKARLKEIQRWLLHEILDHVPPHDAAHGFTRGRSVVSHAGLHAGQGAVLRLDLKDFFASIAAARVHGIFRTIGYTPAVARVLTGLSTNTVPLAVWQTIASPAEPRLAQPQFWLGRQLATPHLPQGAPTSPALANLAAFRLDLRLTGLAASLGLNYSRYADDLAFSGPRGLRSRAGRLEQLVAEIARDEGFALNRGKSALRTAGGRQSVCGIVVNAHPNVTRPEYDRLKAILHNAARYGPHTQNRAGVPDLEAHLRGRIAWVAALNPQRGEQLRRRFAEIDWGGSLG